MDYPRLGIVSGLTLICAALAVRAFRARRWWVKLASGLPAALFGAIFGSAILLALVGYGKLNAVRPNPVPSLIAANTPQLVADGERFARTCASCHAANGQLPLTVDAFIALLRTGTYAHGRRLTTEMPWQGLAGLSDDDLRAIYAHLEQVGPSSASQPARP